ncbi:MAG: MraY family glycosyltransferase [Vicinamibacterales bacterium]
MIGGILQALLIALAAAVILVPFCRILAHRIGVVAHPRNDRWHRSTVPLLGGVAIAMATLAASLMTGVAAAMVVPLSGAMLIFALGLLDDILSLKPSTKLIFQVAMAAALVYFGFRLNWLESRLLDSALTMAWVVGLTNAFNLLDNMDGLCAGTAVVVALMLIAGFWTGVTREDAVAEMTYLAIIAGATIGFLFYNFPPASIFMGDSGSLLLGFSLATLTLTPGGVRGSRSDVVSVIAGPVFVLLVPIFDTTLVTVARLLSGRSPAMGGRDHSSHRLVAIGLSERNAVFVLWLLAAIGGAIGLTLRTSTQGSIAAGALFVAGMCVFAVYLVRIRVYGATAAAPPKTDAVTPLAGTFMYKRRVVEVIVDVGLVVAAYYITNRQLLDPEAYMQHADSFYASLPLILAAQLLSFFAVGVYRGTWHYFGMKDGIIVIKGVAVGLAAAAIVVVSLYRDPDFTWRVSLLYAAIVAVLVITSRLSLRLVGRALVLQRRANLRLTR